MNRPARVGRRGILTKSMGSSGNILTRSRIWADAPSLLLGEYSRVLRKRRRWPLPARTRPVWVRTRRLQTPIRARLGTSDFLVIADLLARGADDGRGEYDAAIDAAARNAGGADNVRLVVDLGANIGLAALMFAHAFPQASAIAVEPDRANFGLMQDNTRHVRSIQCVQACIGATRRTVMLDRSGHGGEPWAIAMKDPAGDHCDSDSADRMQTVTIDDLLPGDAPIDLLKCDIEGAERELFEHCRGWIDRVRVMVVELHAPYGRDEFLDHVRRGCNSAAPPLSVTVLKQNSAVQVLLLEQPINHGPQP